MVVVIIIWSKYCCYIISKVLGSDWRKLYHVAM